MNPERKRSRIYFLLEKVLIMTLSIEEYVADDIKRRLRESQKERLERDYELNIKRAVEAKDDMDRQRFTAFAVNARKGLIAIEEQPK
ncbi:MAG: hypothetical protein APF80_08170 [Alphaproteobacteria bacterium BRH_c36]|nr:MAG: hypothetical protein APF80_08170 [Alphaproteobacteria bacterium BRH_c36]